MTNFSQDFLLQLLTFVVLLCVLFCLKKMLMGRFSPYLNEVLKKTSVFLIALTLFSILLPTLPAQESCLPLLPRAGLIAFALQLGIWGNLLLPWLLKNALLSRRLSQASIKSVLPILTLFAKALFWVLILLFVINNLGFDVTALVTGLGIGGIAIALAAQNVLGDFFACISIILDRPFLHGEYIEVQGITGSVQDIGLKTTRIQSNTGEEVIFGNSELLKATIRNHSRTKERRIELNLTLSVLTAEDRWEEITSLLVQTIHEMEGVRFDRASLTSYTPQALIYQVMFYSNDPSPAAVMERQQSFIAALAKKLKEKDLHFADPTIPIILEQRQKGANTIQP